MVDRLSGLVEIFNDDLNLSAQIERKVMTYSAMLMNI